MLTFIAQAATGFSRLFITTSWGKGLCQPFRWIRYGAGHPRLGGNSDDRGIRDPHRIYLLTRIDWRNLRASIFGPDSLVPNLGDFKHLWQRILWFFGLSAPPKLNRWAYWEKFDYWAVYWGLPLLAVTGLMTMYPLATSRILPGWSLNIAALLHRAEAILAVTYIFIVHFFIGHLRPSSFPMNEGMFAGSVPLEELAKEKPAWIERLKKEGKLELAQTAPPALWYRVVYYFFGYAVLAAGVYLLINGIVYSQYIRLH